MPKDKKPSTQDTQEAIEIEKLLMPKYSREDMPESFTAILQNADKAIKNDLETLKKSREMETIKSLFPDAVDWLDANGDRALYASFICFMIYDAAEIIQTVYLKEQGGKASLSDFTRVKNGKSKLGEFFSQIREKDGALVYEHNSAESVAAVRPTTAIMPLDRISDKFWNMGDLPKDLPAQVDRNKRGLDVLLIPKKKYSPKTVCTVDFTEILKAHPDLEAKFNKFDERVCVAIGALYEAGNRIVTIDQIHYAMGSTSKPSAKQRKKIYDSITKFGAYFNAYTEIPDKFKGNRDKYKGIGTDGPFIVYRRVYGVKINGQEPDVEILLYEYPPILRFARELNQAVTIPIELLQNDIRKTSFTISIEDYLIGRIAQAKRGYEPATIRLETMYKKCGAGSREQKKRLRDYAARFLENYKVQNWINNYTIEGEKITLDL